MAIRTLDTPGTPATNPVRSRRALLTAALGGLGGLFASRLGAPDQAAAAAGDPFVLGAANSAGTTNSILTTSSSGAALLVTQNGSGAALRGSAVGPGSIAGFFTAANGTGISGVTANPDAYGVFGSNDAAAGTGGAIRASGKNNDGLVATTASAANAAVIATNSAIGGTAGLFQNTGGGTTFNAGPAIRAYTEGGSNAAVHPGGVYGDAAGEFAGVNGLIGGSTGAGHGLIGLSVSGYGVRGEAAAGAGVRGGSTTGYGVYGISSTGYAGFFMGKVGVSEYIEIQEMTAPAAPSANHARLFVRDNGGKTEMCVLFPTGAIQVIKTEA